MVRIKLYIFIAAALSLIAGCTEETINIDGTGIVTGTVVEDETFLPLSNARISTNPTSSTVFTDENGQFTLEITNGTYAVRAEKDGFLVKFESAEVETDQEVSVVFELQISTANNRPPPAASLTFPEDNAIGVPFNVTLEWDVMDVDGDSLTYDVQLRNGTTDVIENFTGLEVRELETTLQFGTTYFWQVTATDGINAPVNSVVNRFTTAQFPDNRFHFVRKMGNNNVIYSGNDEDEAVSLTSPNTNSWRPRFNRSISKIAFLRNVGAAVHVFTMDPDGNNVRQITSSVPVTGFNLDEVDISWTNNGSALFYPSLDKLYRINADGSGLALIYQTTNNNLITEVNYNDGLLALKTNDLNGYNVNIFTIVEATGNIGEVIQTGLPGAAGGIELSIDNTRLLYNRDVSGFQNPSYRQIDSRIFIYTFSTRESVDVSLNKEGGTNDLDPRFSPTDAQIILTNRSNDRLNGGVIQLLDLNAVEPREELFENSFMPDWE